MRRRQVMIESRFRPRTRPAKPPISAVNSAISYVASWKWFLTRGPRTVEPWLISLPQSIRYFRPLPNWRQLLHKRNQIFLWQRLDSFWYTKRGPFDMSFCLDPNPEFSNLVRFYLKNIWFTWRPTVFMSPIISIDNSRNTCWMLKEITWSAEVFHLGLIEVK